jgi:hypothetical protein
VESGRRFGDPISYDQLIQLDAHGWELYNLQEDFAETNNLAAVERDRLIGMWYVEAGKYNVLPIDSRGTQMVPTNAAPRGCCSWMASRWPTATCRITSSPSPTAAASSGLLWT